QRSHPMRKCRHAAPGGALRGRLSIHMAGGAVSNVRVPEPIALTTLRRDGYKLIREVDHVVALLAYRFIEPLIECLSCHSRFIKRGRDPSLADPSASLDRAGQAEPG